MEDYKGSTVKPHTWGAHNASLEEIHDLVTQNLAATGKYHNIALYDEGCKEGGTRLTYTAEWGMKNQVNKKRVIIKADRPSWQISDRAKLNLDRGYDTEHEIALLASIEDPEMHHIARIRDFFVFETAGKEKVSVSVEDFFNKSESLYRLVQEAPISAQEFAAIFKPVAEGVHYLNRIVGIYHRDLKPSNILVRHNRPGNIFGRASLEVLITDLANAGSIKEIRSNEVPTAGGNTITNPFLFERFTGSAGVYDEKSELYSLGSTMYFALTGRFPVECDPFNGKVMANLGTSKEDLLDSERRLSQRKFESAIETLTRGSNLEDTWVAPKVKNCLLAPLGKGYGSIQEMAVDFGAIPNPKKKMDLFLIGFLAVAVGAGMIGINYVSNMEKELKGSRKLNEFLIEKYVPAAKSTIPEYYDVQVKTNLFGQVSTNISSKLNPEEAFGILRKLEENGMLDKLNELERQNNGTRK
jgi:serine/threonine protein kinase